MDVVNPRPFHQAVDVVCRLCIKLADLDQALCENVNQHERQVGEPIPQGTFISIKLEITVDI